MASFGFFSNTINFVTSKFRESGKSFKEAYDVVKEFSRKKDKLNILRSWQESRRFYRLKPFIEKMPEFMRVIDPIVTQTSLRLRSKYQYTFDVGFKITDQAVTEDRFYSFLADNKMTKREALAEMSRILMDRMETHASAILVINEIRFTGIRSTRWLPD